MALAAALAWVAPRIGVRAGAVTVDHGLQDGSAARARAVAATLIGMGLDPVVVVHVRGDDGHAGPEGNARAARYAALDAVADCYGAGAVLLGHTLDDQAESVLLGLARGSGARSLSGMSPHPSGGRFRRPLLQLSRAVVRAALPDEFAAWEDPHNSDPAYARSRVRHRVLPALEAELGPGVAAALARSADLLRSDADALDAWAERAYAHIVVDAKADGAGLALELDGLRELPTAVRTRVVRRAALRAGCAASDLTAAHVAAIDELLTAWHGQAGIDLPGAIRARREGRHLSFGPVP